MRIASEHYEQPKPPGTFRILGLGDSVTYGSGVNAAETYLALVGQHIQRQFPGCTLEVLNAGRPAWDTIEEVKWLKQDGIRYEPDIVLIGFYLNDATHLNAIPEYFERIERRLNFKNRSSWWYEHCNLYRFIKRRLDYHEVHQRILQRYKDSFYQSQEQWSLWLKCAEALREAQRMSREHGFRLLVVVLPILTELKGEYPFQDIIELVLTFCAENDIAAMTVLDGLRGYDARKLWIAPDDQHPNATGHRLIAAPLVRHLEEHGYLNECAGNSDRGR